MSKGWDEKELITQEKELDIKDKENCCNRFINDDKAQCCVIVYVNDKDVMISSSGNKKNILNLLKVAKIYFEDGIKGIT